MSLGKERSVKQLLELINPASARAVEKLPTAPRGVISKGSTQKLLQASCQHLPTLLPTTALKDDSFAFSSTFQISCVYL